MDELKIHFNDFEAKVNLTTDTPIIRRVYRALEKIVKTGQSLSGNQTK